jgi:hypothetical protein
MDFEVDGQYVKEIFIDSSRFDLDMDTIKSKISDIKNSKLTENFSKIKGTLEKDRSQFRIS